MLNKNSPGLLKKGAAKQSKIKSIAWHLRWLVRTRADIGLRPSGLVRSRTDIKLQPSELVRSRTDIKLRPSAFVRTRTDFKLDWEDHTRTDTRASLHTNLFKLSFGHFLSFKFHASNLMHMFLEHQ